MSRESEETESTDPKWTKAQEVLTCAYSGKKFTSNMEHTFYPQTGEYVLDEHADAYEESRGL